VSVVNMTDAERKRAQVEPRGCPMPGACSAVDPIIELATILRELLALPVAQSRLSYLDRGIGTDTPEAVWMRARAALAQTEGCGLD